KRVFDANTEAATKAVRHLGTNALPCLVRWIAYEPSAWRKLVAPVLWKLPIGRARNWWWRRDKLSMNAGRAFQILGPMGSPAVGELVRIIKEPGRHMSRTAAVSALSDMGEVGFPAVLKMLEGPKTEGYSEALLAVMKMYEEGVDISPAIPALLLSDRQTEVYARTHP